MVAVSVSASRGQSMGDTTCLHLMSRTLLPVMASAVSLIRYVELVLIVLLALVVAHFLEANHVCDVGVSISTGLLQFGLREIQRRH